MLEFRLGRYRHFKGQEYELIGVARHSETLEPMAVYRALYGDGALWVRPMELFLGEVVSLRHSEAEDHKHDTGERHNVLYTKLC